MHQLLFRLIFLCFILNHPFLFAMDKEVPSFILVTVKTEQIDNVTYPVKRYEYKNTYVEIIQSFPMLLTTNFSTPAEDKNIPKPRSYLGAELKQRRLNINMLPNFIKIFLGDIGIKDNELYLHYKVDTNVDKNKTVISCYGEAVGSRGVPRYQRYNCFCPENKLLARYSTYFSPACPNGPQDDRSTVFLYHLNNVKKKYAIKINQKYIIDSIFLEGHFLIVGSWFNSSHNKIIKNKYHIDIFNAENFSRNENAADLDKENKDVTYVYGIDIEHQRYSNGETEKNNPLLKLVTVGDYHCTIQEQSTKECRDIIYKSTNPKGYTENNLKISYCNNTDPSGNSIQSDTSKQSTINTEKNNDEKYLHNSYLQAGIGSAALLTFLIAVYNYKKCMLFFKKIYR